MTQIIKCPVCGEDNPPDQEFCLYCRSRLSPLTGALKGVDGPIKPGQIPTKKNTAELEPILPQWLRDARDSARKSAGSELVPEEKPKQDSFSALPPDLLAGLQTQKGISDDEETPDWLANLAGDSLKTKKDQPESSEVRWVELGGVNDFAAEESAEKESDDDLSDWFRDASGSQTAPKADPFPAMNNTPEWLRQMAADSQQNNDQTRPLDSNETPGLTPTDWLRSFAAEDESESEPPKDAGAAPDADSALVEEPDWLRMLGGSQEETQSAESPAFSEPARAESEPAAGSSAAEIPEWMKNLPPESNKPRQGTVPLWLKDETPEPSAQANVPAWLSALPEPAAEEKEEQPAVEDSAIADIPDWLQAAAPQSSLYSPEEQAPAAPSSDGPEWLKAFKDSKPQSTPAFSADEPLDSSQPAFTPEAQASYNMDALFTDMPEWLSQAADNSNSANSTFPATDSLTPGELPSWVQAMRPIGSSDTSFSIDETLETRGALAGLQGVLPAVPGYAATSRPKAHSIKLQASEEQQTHAAFLEQVLAAEAAPIPIAVFSPLQKSRGLRWLIAFTLFAVLSPVLFLGSRFFAMPAGSPREINSALQTLQSIPAGAPILAAFDYEPARSAEMESVAAAVFKLMQSPNLTVISTNETGGILADRFLSGPSAGFGAEGGIQYLNLGYLPGGQVGIRAFGQNPPAAVPFDVSLAAAWTSPQLQGITSLSQFAALVIVTDSANSARAWIEQTAAVRGTIPVLVISSAQAAPMIQPYYESQQINGLVAGLYGAAVVEQYNGGFPGSARTYWDSYSIGMLLAAALILSGGLLNLGLGLQDRAAAREAK
jgi:hypothetical protein